MEKQREEWGGNLSLHRFPPPIKGRKSWRLRVNRNEEAKRQRKSAVRETGKPEEGRKKEIHTGEGPERSRENGRLQEAPGFDNLLLGLPLSPGRAGGPPGTAQAGLLTQEDRD